MYRTIEGQIQWIYFLSIHNSGIFLAYLRLVSLTNLGGQDGEIFN